MRCQAHEERLPKPLYATVFPFASAELSLGLFNALCLENRGRSFHVYFPSLKASSLQAAVLHKVRLKFPKVHVVELLCVMLIGVNLEH